MTYLLAHFDEAPDTPWEDTDPHEEIYVNPFGTKLMVAVPIAGLRHLLPILEDTAADRPIATCPGCGCELPAPTEVR